MNDGTIAIEDLDLVICGQTQYSFKVYDEVTGWGKADNLSAAVVTSTYKRAVVMDGEVTAISDATTIRADKAEEVGTCLSDLTLAQTSFAGDAQLDEWSTSDKSSSVTWALGEARRILQKYDIKSDGTNDNEVIDYTNIGKQNHYLGTYTDAKGVTHDCYSAQNSDIQLLATATQLELDRENNALQQESNNLQSVMGKRDDAYALIGKLQEKLDKTMKRTIQQIAS